MTFLAIITLVLIVVIISIAKKVFKLELVSPPILMTFLWSGFILVSLLFFQGYPWYYWSFLWILLACVMFTLGYVIFDVYSRKQQKILLKKELQTEINISAAKKILIALTVLGFVYTGIKLAAYGVSVSSLFNIGQLAEINNSVAVARYTGGPETSFISQILLTFVYAAPLFGGFVLAYVRSKKEKLLCLISLLPVFTAFSVTNEKATFILSIIFILVGYLAGCLNKNGEFPRLNVKNILGALVVGIALISILIISMMMRVGEINTENFGLVMQKISNSYALSHMPAFDRFFASIDSTSQPFTLGQYTFYGIADFLGFASREQGVYQDYFIYNEISTNVYTAFRGLILDFGVIGALFFQFIGGLVTGVAVMVIRRARQSSIALGVLVAAYSFVLFFVVSVFSYMSLTLSLVLFVVACKLVLKRRINA